MAFLRPFNKLRMPLTQIFLHSLKGGYVIDFTLNNERYRETIPAPHNKSALKRIEDRETVYKFAISMNDKSIADKFP